MSTTIIALPQHLGCLSAEAGETGIGVGTASAKVVLRQRQAKGVALWGKWGHLQVKVR